MNHTDPDRHLARIVDICVIVMADYHIDCVGDAGSGLMVAEIRAIAAWAASLGVDYDRAEGEILRPVSDALVARYGRETGDWLYGRFRDAFVWRPWQLN